MLNRFSGSARAAVGHALLSARSREHDALAPSDLAMGIVQTLPPTTAALVPALSVRAASPPVREPASGPASASPALAFSEEARGLLETASDEADRRDHRTVTTLHLLSALLLAPSQSVRAEFGLQDPEQLAALRAQVERALAADPSE